jgi:hypothetical protein
MGKCHFTIPARISETFSNSKKQIDPNLLKSCKHLEVLNNCFWAIKKTS